MTETHVAGVLAIHILAELLTEDCEDVLAGDERIDKPLIALITVFAVAAEHRHCAHHNGVTDWNALGVTENDRGSDWVCLRVLVGPDAGIPGDITNCRKGHRAILDSGETLGNRDLVAVIAGRVRVHADFTWVDSGVARVDDEEVLLGRTRRVDIVREELEREVREEPEVLDIGDRGSGGRATTLDREGSSASGDCFAKECLGVEPRTGPSVTVWIDRIELDDTMTVDVGVAALEQRILIVSSLTRRGLTKNLLVV